MIRDQGIQYDPKSQKAIDNLKKISLNTKRGINKAFNDIGAAIIKTSISLIASKDKSGRVYFNVPYTSNASGKSQVKKRHQASAPGQPPANLSGRLKSDKSGYKSMNYQIQGGVSISIGNRAPYAAKLEFGGNNVKPRPFLKPAIDNNKKDIEFYFQDRVKVEITAGAPTI